ncbi:MAG: hypothetical protein GY716_00745 [bacterium]|nr:hypothetical protein [bacterium]
MSHYEERLAQDLAAIRKNVASLGRTVERALSDAVRAALTLDRDLAYSTVLADLPVNRKVRECDQQCHAFVARHLPSAGHLRFVSSVLRLNIALERIGDYAVAISREAVQLSAPPPETVARDIQLLAEQNTRTLNQAMQAFNDGNAEMARGVVGLSKQLAATFDRVFSDLISAGEKGKRPQRDLFALLVMFNRLGRVGDQAKNICEETLFTVTGETKQPKVYRILFVDSRNDCASQIAAAYASKAFPEGGRYSSAGWNASDGLAPAARSFLDERGYDSAAHSPTQITTVHEELAEFHVIVSLEPDAKQHLAELPFHTVLLEWHLEGVDPGACCADQEALDSLLKQVGMRVTQLMETLRGEGTGS